MQRLRQSSLPVYISICLLAAVGLAGCGDEATTTDAGADVGSTDRGFPLDTGINDLGVDTGARADAGSEDTGSDAGSNDVGTDAGDAGFVPPNFGQWVKFEPPGALCADGSPYKFFVKFSNSSSNVLIFLQGGGACWDYASCTGTGIRSAANPNGIADDYATNHTDLGGLEVGVDLVYPLLNDDATVSPMSDWNKVFVPYCTGDVYSGDTTVTYDDPDGIEPSVEFRHFGHRNIQRMTDMLEVMFETVPRMMVGGCSAGGVGALTNYYTFRTRLNPDRAYLLDDSGPLFPDQAATARSLLLHNRVRTAWNIDPLIQSIPRAGEVSADFGKLAEVLAGEFPNDRLATSFFQLDYNYSLYSYERFYTVDEESGQATVFEDGMGLGGLGLDETAPEDRAAVYSLFADDTALLVNQFDQVSNLGYFVPYYRTTNSSHCLTIPGIEEFPEDQIVPLLINDLARLAWAGTEVATQTSSITLQDYVVHLLDDATPLESHFESDPEGRYVSCAPANYDEAMCAAAVAD